MLWTIAARTRWDLEAVMNFKLPLLALLVVLCGCSRVYVMKLSSGQTITTAGKPKLKGSRYFFKDAGGKPNWVPQSRVLEIEPASMAKEEKPAFKGTSGR
jgi:hypothetical protein